MARTSKRKTCLECQRKTYTAGVYARLSVDNHDGKAVSIENQIEMAKQYLNMQRDIRLYDCYSDLGATGTNFGRSEFERLMQDIREERVNCVIVKDFSRFGRNYIETGNFVEKIFPFMGVRFISITDEYDSEKPLDGNEALSMHLKNIANELYARDIAEKVTASKRLKTEKGEFVGSVAPYGYTVERINNKRMLVREEVTSDIVRQIFERYDAGETFASIVTWLYEQKIHRPSDYKRYKMVYQQEGQKLKQWEGTTVRMMLTNPTYLGKLVQSGNDTEEPISVEHTHEPLVAEEMFFRAGERIAQNAGRQKHGSLKKEMSKDMFQGILYCGECGHKLVRMVNEKKVSYAKTGTFVFYGCPNNRRMDDERCESEHITFFQLQKIIVETLKKEFDFSGVSMKKFTGINHEEAKKRRARLQREQAKLQKSVDKIGIKISSCYLEYRKGRISQAQFLEQKRKLEEEGESRRRKLLAVQEEADGVDKRAEEQNRFLCALFQCKEHAELNADLVQNLIEKIEVYRGKRAAVVWKWKDTFRETLGGTCDAK